MCGVPASWHEIAAEEVTPHPRHDSKILKREGYIGLVAELAEQALVACPESFEGRAEFGRGHSLPTFRNIVSSIDRLMRVVQATGKLISSAVPRRTHLIAAVPPNEENAHGRN